MPDRNTEPGTLCFQCNICGNRCSILVQSLNREIKSCSRCGSTTRQRAVIRALSAGLFGQDLVLAHCPARKDIKGLGLTDSEGYASKLREKFDYVNTYFHQEPRLDITDEPPTKERGAYDFIISSDVFEHVVPPVAKAFHHVYRMLKPGGIFVLTVPYGNQEKTIEHYPELHQFEVVEVGGTYELHNVTTGGVHQIFRNLVFHGGQGSTLEMRLFACADIMLLLKQVGFASITVHNIPAFRYGIWWPGPFSFPFSSRKPRAAAVTEQ